MLWIFLVFWEPEKGGPLLFLWFPLFQTQIIQQPVATAEDVMVSYQNIRACVSNGIGPGNRASHRWLSDNKVHDMC